MFSTIFFSPLLGLTITQIQVGNNPLPTLTAHWTLRKVLGRDACLANKRSGQSTDVMDGSKTRLTCVMDI